MITQFNITGKSGATITYKHSVRLQKYWRIQGAINKETTADEYNKALAHYNANRPVIVHTRALSFSAFLQWCNAQHAVAVA